MSSSSSIKKLSPGCLVKTTRHTPYTFFEKQLKERKVGYGYYSAPMKLSVHGEKSSIEVPEGVCMMFLSLDVVKIQILYSYVTYMGQAKALLDEQVVHVQIPYSSGSYQDALRNSYNFLYNLFEIVD